MERRRKGEWRRRSKADGEEGNENENCREMEKVLNGKKKKKNGRKGGRKWVATEEESKNVKDAF